MDGGFQPAQLRMVGDAMSAFKKVAVLYGSLHVFWSNRLL
jgi:hypothetical protein